MINEAEKKMTNEKETTRLCRYDNLKFLLILLVVVGHFVEPYVLKSHMMKSIWIFIYTFHMPVFIFTVGLFSKRVIKQPYFRGERIYSYVALFFLYKTLLYITKILCGAKASFSLLTESGIPWFMLSCAFFLLLTQILKKQNPVIVFTEAILVACLAGYENSIGDFLCLSRTIAYYPFFLLGYYLDVDKIEKFLSTKRVYVGISFCALILLGVFCFVYTDKIYVLRPLFTGRNPFSTLPIPALGAVYRLLHYLGVLCLLPGLLAIVPVGNKFFTIWGTRTLQIYVLHRPILYLYNSKWKVNTYLIDIFPTYWKLIYLALGVTLTVILACKLFEPPFKQIMSWRPTFLEYKGEYLGWKQRIKRIFLIALLFSFTLCLFGPLELYCSNSEELWFGLLPATIISIVGFIAALLLICALALIVNGNIFSNYRLLLFGMAIGLYIQGNFLNIDYGTGVLDGGKINWGEYETYALVNCILWIICLILPFVIKKIYKNYHKVFAYASILLVLMQTSALVVSLIQTRNTTSASYTITTDGMYTLSKGENIIVFALDTMDEQYMTELLERHPEYKAKLQGFTHYDNTLASGARTVVALPSMLTGIPFKKETSFSDYVENIWNGNTPLDTLNNLGYDVRVFTDAMYYGAGAEKCINNFSTKLQNVGSYKILAKKLGKLTLYKYSPHIVKKVFWFNTAEFDLAKPENIYSPGDAKFYKNYTKENFHYTDEYTKAFRFYLLDGAHQPYTLTEKATRDKKGTSRNRQIDGCFLIVFDILNDLKKNDLYDSSTIIITADHGDKNLSQQPIFMCKLPNATEEFKTVKSPISLFDFSATLVYLAGGDGNEFGSGINLLDVEESAIRERYFYLNTEKNSKSCIQEYVTTDYAGNLDALSLKNEYFDNGGVVQPYQLGESLTFAMDATANQYCTYGFRLSTGWRTPLAGPYSQMVIPLAQEPETDTLLAHFDIKSIDTVSYTIIKSNETVVFEGTIDDSYIKTGLDFEIPVSSLVDNAATLNFDFPDIDQSEMKLETSRRTMTISFESFVIDTIYNK